MLVFRKMYFSGKKICYFCITSVPLFLSVQGDSRIVLFKIRGRGIHATTTTTTRRPATRKSSSSEEGRRRGSVAQAPSFFRFWMETCRWDVKNSSTFKFSVKSFCQFPHYSCGWNRKQNSGELAAAYRCSRATSLGQVYVVTSIIHYIKDINGGKQSWNALN